MSTDKKLFKAIQQRLAESLDKAGISMRAASLAAKRGPGYVQALVTDGVEPTISNLADVCEANGISLAYVVLGIEASKETLDLIDFFQKNPEKRDSVLSLVSPET